MRIVEFVTPALTALVLTLPTSADVTTSGVILGGPGSCSSEGFNDPGLLADGITPASAILHMALDTGTNKLTLTVQNTSPVTMGVNNPVLCEIDFNVPVQVTGMTLSSQTGSGGATPNFTFTFDSDTTSNPNPNVAGPFGAFNAGLVNPMGVNGCIANPLADTLAPMTLVTGPVVFVFCLTGDLTGVTASDFANTFSSTPPGNKPSNAAGHFQSGGVAEASAFINNGDIEPCFLVMGAARGGGVFVGPDPENHPFTVQVDGLYRVVGMTLKALATIPKPGLEGDGIRLASPQVLPGERVVVDRFWVQGLLWNPKVFPDNPEQWTHVMRVTVWSDGDVTVRRRGSNNNMTIDVETFTTTDGREFLRFPFMIQ